MLRRWLIALGVIAVAGLAVAIFAVVDAGESSRAARVASVERSLNRGLEDVSRRLEDFNRRIGVEQSAITRLDRREHMDVAGLAGRLQGLENNNVKAVKAAAETNRKLSALSTRVDTLTQKGGQQSK